MPVLWKLLGCRRITCLAMHQTGSISRLTHHQVPSTASLPHSWNCSLYKRSCPPPLSQLALLQPFSGGCNNSSSSIFRHHRLSRVNISRDRPRHLCQASSQPADSSQQPSGSSTVLTIPTILTLARVAAIPAVIAAWFWQHPAASAWVTGLFIAASITDWLDGYLARKMNASSAFGAFLDPVADKLMVATVLVLLSTQPLAAGPLAGNAWVMPVATLIIVGREITMSALREWAATLGPEARSAVAVNAWGKWKTASQMVALTCLLITKDGASSQLAVTAAMVAMPLLAIASYLTAHSLAVYMTGLWKYMK